MEKTPKDFLCDILRRAYITKEDSYKLYDIIHDECLEALAQGKEVNLFDVALIRPAFKKGHRRNSLNGMIEVPDRVVLKTRVAPKLNTEWKYINGD